MLRSTALGHALALSLLVAPLAGCATDHEDLFAGGGDPAGVGGAEGGTDAGADSAATDGSSADGDDAGEGGEGGEAGSVKVTPGFGCGPTTCLEGITCCLTQFPAPSATCSGIGCPPGSSTLGCDESADCAGRICCAQRNPFAGPGGNQYSIRCADTCSGATDFVACRATSQCEAGKTCQAFAPIVGYEACQ